MDILSRMCRINDISALKAEMSTVVNSGEDGTDLPEHIAVKDYKEIKVYCYNTNICTNK